MLETYTYGGLGGRVSNRRTQFSIAGANTDSFNQSFSYDALGNAATVGYPQCEACGTPAPRTVSFTYTQGRLTAVPGYTGTVSGQPVGVGITYHPGGMVHQVAHPQSPTPVTDVVAADPYYRPRPSSISTTGAVTNWATGAYEYDGAGNVTKSGAASLLYDGVSRLRCATLSATWTHGTTARWSAEASVSRPSSLPAEAPSGLEAINLRLGQSNSEVCPSAT